MRIFALLLRVIEGLFIILLWSSEWVKRKELREVDKRRFVCGGYKRPRKWIKSVLSPFLLLISQWHCRRWSLITHHSRTTHLDLMETYCTETRSARIRSPTHGATDSHAEKEKGKRKRGGRWDYEHWTWISDIEYSDSLHSLLSCCRWDVDRVSSSAS